MTEAALSHSGCSDPTILFEAGADSAVVNDGSMVDAALDSGADASDAAVDVADVDAKSDAGCNTLVQAAPMVTVQPKSGTPVATGGTLVPGLYFLTEASLYNGQPPPQATIQFTLEVGQGTAQVLSTSMNHDQRGSITWTTNNSNVFTSTTTCPMMQGPSPIPYTATPSTFTLLIDVGNNSYFEEVFTKQ